ncbi:MAG: histone deacetylase [Candidatus Lokiarchaeota archaeon]|nr:histone deacetylase [Candidatus Lokiarchaeota archaeon]
MKNVGIVYDHIYAEHKTNLMYSHPERADRVIHAISRLREEGMYGENRRSNFFEIQPRLAALEEIHLAHSESLITEIQEKTVRAAKFHQNLTTDPDTVLSGESYTAALYAAGGNFSAIDAIFDGIINSAFILCRPPGHHANVSASRGFCVFNNIILATQYLMREKRIKKVAIIDWDAHAGNGSEDIVYSGVPNVPEEAELLFFSIHQDPRTLYPGTCFPEDIGQGKQKGKIVNITLPPRSGDDCVQLALDHLILPMLREFKPEYILFSAGFDGHHRDHLTNLGYTSQGYGKIIDKVMPVAEEFAQGRMSLTLEGGYNLEAQSNSIVNVVSKLSGAGLIIEEDQKTNDQCLEYTENKLIPYLKKLLGPYWKNI